MTKRTAIFLTIIVGLFLCASCEKGQIEHENRFERSYEAWLAFKTASGNTYRYEVSGGTWAGSSWLTSITVRQGRVVQRDFHYTVFNDVRMPEGGWATMPVEELLTQLGLSADDFVEREGQPFHQALQWTETESELGTHERTPASGIQTLDEVYHMARTEWLKKRADASVSFEAKNDGLISSAGFWPNGCMDDCFTGISIRSITAID